MKFLQQELISDISEKDFQNSEQFPWIDVPNFLYEDGYRKLVRDMPDIKIFEESFNQYRSYNQRPHNRFILEYKSGIDIPDCWQEFIDELHSKEYIDFLKRMYGVSYLDIRCHWHYSKKGGSVSPHCDGVTKIGSQIFYFNTSSHWDSKWGGQTLVLIDSSEKHDCKSAPGFNDFDKVVSAKSLDNNLFMFARTENSWHGVRELDCPENEFRKIFTIVIDKSSPLQKIKNFFIGKKGY